MTSSSMMVNMMHFPKFTRALAERTAKITGPTKAIIGSVIYHPYVCFVTNSLEARMIFFVKPDYTSWRDLTEKACLNWIIADVL